MGKNPIDRRRETNALAQACMSIMNYGVSVDVLRRNFIYTAAVVL